LIGAEFIAMSNNFAQSDIDIVPLIDPTTNDERLAKIGIAARGFVSALSRKALPELVMT